MKYFRNYDIIYVKEKLEGILIVTGLYPNETDRKGAGHAPRSGTISVIELTQRKDAVFTIDVESDYDISAICFQLIRNLNAESHIAGFVGA